VLVVDSGSGWEADAAGVVRIADLLRRTRAVVGEPTLLAVTLTGPATAGGPLAGAVQHVLAAARAAAEAGAGVVFVDERVDAPPDGYARAVTPLWGALKFMRALGVLKAPWAGVLPRGPFLPCGAQALDRPHGLAVEPGAAVPPGHTAALVTHTEDLAGHVPIRDLRAALELLG